MIKLRRETVQRVRCPRCGAAPGTSCKGEKGQARKSNHIGRIKKAQSFIASQLGGDRA